MTPSYRAHCRAPHPSPKGLTQEGPDVPGVIGDRGRKEESPVCSSFSPGSCPQPSASLPPPAPKGPPSRAEQLQYLLTVDELVVKEKEHPLLALGLWLCNSSQLPRVDEF